jgi:hypothetical protein
MALRSEPACGSVRFIVAVHSPADAVYDAAFRRAGLLRVLDLDELFAAAETLGRVRPSSLVGFVQQTGRLPELPAEIEMYDEQRAAHPTMGARAHSRSGAETAR